MGALSLVALPLLRIGAKRLLFRFGRFRRRVLILGAGRTGRLILSALRKEPNYGYKVIGFLDDDETKAGMKIDGLKVRRGINRAPSYLKSGRVSDVIIAMPAARITSYNVCYTKLLRLFLLYLGKAERGQRGYS